MHPHTANRELLVGDAQVQLAQLLNVSVTILHQAIDLVENRLNADDQLVTHSRYLPGSSIGKHLRHVRDHFTLLLDCVSSPPPYILNYDVRLRNRPMESNLQAARSELYEAISQLNSVVPKANLDDPITLHAVTPFPQSVQTSFGRELWFAALHAVHHFSMVRLIAGEMGVQLPEEFGFAPSTLVHHGKEAPLGKAKI